MAKKVSKTEEEKNEEVTEPVNNIPWSALIICGVLLLLMIGCIITIICLSK